jgi:hypothetical protein
MIEKYNLIKGISARTIKAGLNWVNHLQHQQKIVKKYPNYQQSLSFRFSAYYKFETSKYYSFKKK